MHVKEGWQHLAVVFSDAGTNETSVTMYLQGQRALGPRLLGADIGDLSAGRPWSFGQDWDGAATTDFFKGLMDEVVFFDQALSSNEVEALCRMGVYTHPTQMHYPLNDVYPERMAEGPIPYRASIPITNEVTLLLLPGIGLETNQAEIILCDEALAAELIFSNNVVNVEDFDGDGTPDFLDDTPDIAVTKIGDAGFIQAGSNATFHAEVHNLGAGHGGGILFEDAHSPSGRLVTSSISVAIPDTLIVLPVSEIGVTNGSTIVNLVSNGLDFVYDAGADTSNKVVAGQIGSGLFFDGMDDAADSSSFALSNNFTIAFHANISAVGTAQAFIGKHTAAGANELIVALFNGGYHLRLRGDSHEEGTLSTGWQHLAVTGNDLGNGNTLVTFYKNGLLLWNHVFTEVVGDVTGGLGWTLGQEWDGTNRTDFFSGVLDELVIYNRALVSGEIAELAASTQTLGQVQASTNGFSVALGGLAPGQMATLDYEMSTTSGVSTTYTNIAQVTSGYDDLTLLTNNVAVALVNTTSGGDLSLSKTTSTPLVGEPGIAQYSLTVSNAGPGSVNNLLVRDQLPNRFLFDPPTGAVWHLHLDESPATNLAIFIDSSGQGRDAQLTNSVTTNASTIGVFDQGIALDASEDFIVGPAFGISNSFTLSLWVNPESTSNGQAFLSKHSAAGGNQFILGYYNSGYHVRIHGETHEAGTPRTGWQQLTLVGEHLATNSTDLSLYQDGQLLWGPQNFSAELGDVSGGLGWSLGQEWDGTNTSDHLTGLIDEVVFFSRVLDADELFYLAHYGLYSEPSNAVFTAGELAPGATTNFSFSLPLQVALGAFTNEAAVSTTSHDANPLNNNAEVPADVDDTDSDGTPDFADADNDNDGMSDDDEAFALTDPFDANSVLQILNLNNVVTNVFELTIPTAIGRLYDVEISTNLVENIWTNKIEGVEGTGSDILLLETNMAERTFFRTRVYESQEPEN